jgi:hypothetical protein
MEAIHVLLTSDNIQNSVLIHVVRERYLDQNSMNASISVELVD